MPSNPLFRSQFTESANVQPQHICEHTLPNMLASSLHSPPRTKKDTSSSYAALIIVILACAVVAISMLLYILHWCRQKRKASCLGVIDDQDSSSEWVAEGESAS
jgi:hypothetical protein